MELHDMPSPSTPAAPPKPPTPKRNPPTISTTTTILIFLLLLSLFPSAFHLLWTLPLRFLLPAFFDPSPTPFTTTPAAPTMSWTQKQFTLPSRSRGSYLITDLVLKELGQDIKTYKVGLLHLFVQHTSCGLSLNENWDSDVRLDMSDTLDRIVPEAGPKGEALYRHDAEGPDDFPAHVKSSLMGASVTVPIKDGKLALGTWQGVWFLEFRTAKHTRNVVATIQGQKA